MNVPVLRFPEFSGEWEIKKLNDVCNKIMDGTHFSPKSKEGTKKYLTSKNIRNTGLDISNCNYISEEEHNEIYKKCPVKLGDILLTKDGANTGNCCINTLQEEFSLLSSVAVLSGKEKILNSLYLLQLLQSQKGITTISNTMAGQAITRITLEKINKFKFPFPEHPEQTKIADFLTQIDNKISQLSQKKQLLERYKKGVMQQIFSQSIRFTDDDGREFPEWEEKEIGEVFQVTRGNVLAMPLVSNTQNEENLYPVYSSQTKNNGLSGFYRDYLYEDCITWTTDGANAGDVNYRNGKFYCTNVCGVLVNKNGFANACISSMINAISKNYVSYVGNPKLMNNVMAKISINFPCVEEQTKIANFLTALDNKIALVESQLNGTKQYKKGLLQQLFV